LFEHASARFDGGELMGVADEHRFGSLHHRARQQRPEIWGGDHGGLVDDDEC
jgi:hypothetical protein